MTRSRNTRSSAKKGDKSKVKKSAVEAPESAAVPGKRKTAPKTTEEYQAVIKKQKKEIQRLTAGSQGHTQEEDVAPPSPFGC